MSYDTTYAIGWWAGVVVLVIGFCWLATQVGKWRTQMENEAAARRARIAARKAAEKRR